jgi:ATPase subunit of ABC transporter with duplicated ATPase domains
MRQRLAIMALISSTTWTARVQDLSRRQEGVENIHLNFLPGVKIGVVGVNGAGKSTLLRIMAGIDKDFTGEAWAAKGATVGYLPQEPQLDPR